MFTDSFSSDCIGSAFNVKGAMQCPNCREVESGVWRCFGDEGPEQIIDQETNDEVADEFDMVKPRSSLVYVFLILFIYIHIYIYMYKNSWSWYYKILINACHYTFVFL